MMTPQDNPTFAFWKKCCPPRCCTLCTPPTTHSAQGAQPCLVLLLSPTPAVLVGAKQHLIVVFTSTSLKTNNTLHLPLWVLAFFVYLLWKNVCSYPFERECV